MEEKNSQKKAWTLTRWITLKRQLMGPLAGLWGPLFLGTLRLIATGIGNLALKGNVLGPILFLLLFERTAYSG